MEVEQRSFVSLRLCFYFAYCSPLTERRLWGLGVFFCAVVSIHDFQFNLSPLGINSALIPQVPRVWLSPQPGKEGSLPGLWWGIDIVGGYDMCKNSRASRNLRGSTCVFTLLFRFCRSFQSLSALAIPRDAPVFVKRLTSVRTPDISLSVPVSSADHYGWLTVCQIL